MELGNIHRDSYDTLQQAVTANPSNLLFSRVTSVAWAMANPSLRTERELNRLLKPYRDEAESLTAATAAWAVAVLTAEDNMTPTEVAALVSLCVRETHLATPCQYIPSTRAGCGRLDQKITLVVGR